MNFFSIFSPILLNPLLKKPWQPYNFNTNQGGIFELAQNLQHMGKCIHLRLSNHRVENFKVVLIGLYIENRFSYPESFHSLLVKCVQAMKFSTFVRIMPPLILVNIISLSLLIMAFSRSHFIHFPQILMLLSKYGIVIKRELK